MTAFPLEPYRENAARVVASVFETMLNLPLWEDPPAVQPVALPLSAAVAYCGTWRGALLLECTHDQAADWTARLLDVSRPLAAADVLDGLGELANIIAGNLKCLLPSGVMLSVPSVAKDNDANLHRRGDLTETLHLADPFGPFRITLIEVAAAVAAGQAS